MDSTFATAYALRNFSRYCAPTALADLMEVSPLEAARALWDVPRMLCPRGKGAVRTLEWDRYLESLGLVKTDTARPLEEAAALARAAAKKAGWAEGEYVRYSTRVGRHGWDHEVTTYAPAANQRRYRYPTVAQWLRANPTATGILNVRGHTLAVRDGQVSADTLRTKSMRRRVEGAYLMPQEDN